MTNEFLLHKDKIENKENASRTNGTFGFSRHTSRPFTKPKEPFLSNPKQRIINYSNIIMSKMFNQIRAIPLLTFRA